MELLNGKRIKVRYRPQGMAAMMEASNGTPTRKKSTDFSYRQWAKEVLSKLNVALQNIQIVDDLSGKRPDPKNKELGLSLIPPGEYYRIYEACFPGYSRDPADFQEPNNASSGKNRKGIRSGESDPPGQ